MADYIVTITTDPDGNFTHSPSALHVESGDTIAWQCANPFVIQFQEGTPVDNMRLNGRSLRGPSNPFVIAAATVADDASGNFHYSVATWDGTNVWIDAGCPVIIVN